MCGYECIPLINHSDLTFQCDPKSNDIIMANWKAPYDLIYAFHTKFDHKMHRLWDATCWKLCYLIWSLKVIQGEIISDCMYKSQLLCFARCQFSCTAIHSSLTSSVIWCTVPRQYHPSLHNPSSMCNELINCFELALYNITPHHKWYCMIHLFPLHSFV